MTAAHSAVPPVSVQQACVSCYAFSSKTGKENLHDVSGIELSRIRRNNPDG